MTYRSLSRLSYSRTSGREARYLVDRVSEDSKLHEIPAYRVTMLVAPSGYGKTTLVKEWAEKTDLAVHWFELNQFHNQRSIFWKGLVDAFSVSLQAEQRTFYQMIQSASSAYIITTICEQLRSAPESVLVFDDYHMIENKELQQEMAALLGEIPSHIHIVFLSQKFPQRAVKYLGRTQQVLQLSKQDLTFSKDEISRYFEKVMCRKLSEEESARIMEQTEGWPAGMQLMYLYTKLNGSRPSLAGHAFRSLSKPLINELVYELTEAERHYLLCSSILMILTPDLCNKLAGTKKGNSILGRLQTFGLLVFDEEGKSWFRYKEPLRKHLLLLAEHENIDIALLHLRASKWMYEHKKYASAIHHALMSGNYDTAVEYLITAAPRLIQEGVNELINGCLAQIPKQFHSNIDLSIIRAWSACLDQKFEQADRLVHTIEERLLRREIKLEEEQEKQYFSDLYCLKSYLAILRGDARHSLSYAQKSMAYTGVLSRYFPASLDINTVEGQLLNGPIGGGGELRKTKMVYEMLTDFDEASVFGGYYHLVQAELAMEWAQNNRFPGQIQIAVETAKKFGVPGLLVPSYLLYANYCYIHDETGKQSEAALQQLKDLLVTANASSNWFKKLDAARTQFAILTGKSKIVKNWMQLFTLQQPKMEYHTAYEYLTLIRALLYFDEKQQAIQFIDRLLPLVTIGGRKRLLIQLRLLKAMALDVTEQAHAELKEAIRLAADDRYLRTFWCEGDSLRSLVLDFSTTDHVNKKQKKYIQELLAGWDGHSQKQQLSDKLTARELQLIYELSQEKSNQEIAASLELSVGTIKVYLHKLYEKIGVKNRKQARTLAHEIDFSSLQNKYDQM